MTKPGEESGGINQVVRTGRMRWLVVDEMVGSRYNISGDVVCIKQLTATETIIQENAMSNCLRDEPYPVQESPANMQGCERCRDA